jgi:hypothetical protein
MDGPAGVKECAVPPSFNSTDRVQVCEVVQTSCSRGDIFWIDEPGNPETLITTSASISMGLRASGFPDSIVLSGETRRRAPSYAL